MVAMLDNPPQYLPREDARRDRSADRNDRVKGERRREREPQESREEKMTARDERDDRPPRRDHHERRIGQEEHGGAAIAVERRERDREYKHRKSASPPLTHRGRDRSHSPPMQRTPPYKWSRRDDEYGGGRRVNSPRANLGASGGGLPRMSGSSDRRSGYDGMAPYSGHGGQGTGYGGDNRSRGRYGGRSDFRRGPAFGGSGDGSYSHAGPPAHREGLMSYKQFIAELEDDILPAEAEWRYDEYKAEFIATQKRAFFERHKHEEWLREKYDPSRLEAVLSRRNEKAKTLAEDFHSVLRAGTLDSGPSAEPDIFQAKDALQASGVEMEGHEKRGKTLQGALKGRKSDAAPTAPAALGDAQRVYKDIDQARSLIKKLDTEKGIADNVLLTSGNSNADGEKSIGAATLGTIVIIHGPNLVRGLEGIELMDVLLTYLWRVHALDYYGSLEMKDPPKGFRHVRGVEAKGVDDSAAHLAAAEFEKKLDAHWQARIVGQDLIEAMLGRDKLEATASEALDPFVRKIRDEKYGWKYGCGAKGCTKLFNGLEYVHKHLKLKHSELVSGVVAKAQDELYFKNYMGDPDSPGVNQSITLQHLSQRRKN